MNLLLRSKLIANSLQSTVIYFWGMLTFFLLAYKFISRSIFNPNNSYLDNFSVGILMTCVLWLFLLPIIGWAVLKTFHFFNRKALYISIHFLLGIVFSLIHSYLFVYLHILIWPGVLNSSELLSMPSLLSDVQFNVFIYLLFSGLILFQVRKTEKVRWKERTGIIEIDKYQFVIDDIVYIRGAGNYLSIFTKKGSQFRSFLVRESLKNIQEIICSRDFMCLHRSYLANRNYISKIEKDKHGAYHFLMKDGSWIPSSRRLKPEIKSWLSEMN